MNPVVAASIGLLALQASLLVVTVGIFVTTMISAKETLALLQRTSSDIRRREDLDDAAERTGRERTRG